MGQYFPLPWCLAAALHLAEAKNQQGVDSLSPTPQSETPQSHGSRRASASSDKEQGLATCDKAIQNLTLKLQLRAGQAQEVQCCQRLAVSNLPG